MNMGNSSSLKFNHTNLIIIVIVTVLALGGVLLLGTSRTPIVDDSTNVIQNEGNMDGETTQLQSEDLEIGKGVEAYSGDLVSVHYTGTLANGVKFDSSLDRDEPFAFELGAGRVIKGWDEGVVGMRVGGKRKLTIPADLAYGDNGTPDGSIPGGATLIFEIELLSINE